jgi:hypothetical protein
MTWLLREGFSAPVLSRSVGAITKRSGLKPAWESLNKNLHTQRCCDFRPTLYSSHSMFTVWCRLRRPLNPSLPVHGWKRVNCRDRFARFQAAGCPSCGRGRRRSESANNIRTPFWKYSGRFGKIGVICAHPLIQRPLRTWSWRWPSQSVC